MVGIHLCKLRDTLSARFVQMHSSLIDTPGTAVAPPVTAAGVNSSCFGDVHTSLFVSLCFGLGRERFFFFFALASSFATRTGS